MIKITKNIINRHNSFNFSTKKGVTISTFLSTDTIRSILSYVGGEAKYIWGLKGNRDDLQTQKENLTVKKQDLLNKVKLAEQQSRTRRTTTVELWFRRVEEIETRVENLQKEGDQQVDRLCLGGFCSKDLISSYDFGKKVENLKEKVIELKKEGDAMKEVYEGIPEGAAVEMCKIPQQLLSSFSKSQVLRMLHCGPRHQPIVEEGNILSADAESLMKEIHCLEQLNLITLSLHGSRGVENFLKFPKLQNITQALSIEDCAGEVQKMRKLHSVVIRNCSNVKDLTWLVFVPNLKWLRIVGCDDMEEIISVEKLSEVSEMMGELNLFAELEFLSLGYAGNLKRIYRDHLPFPQLKEIGISKCPKLKKLPLNSSSAKGLKIAIYGEKEWWEELQWEDQATQNAFSPCFMPF